MHVDLGVKEKSSEFSDTDNSGVCLADLDVERIGSFNSNSSRLGESGFTVFNCGDLTEGQEGQAATTALLSCFEDLPPDPYANGSGRFRRYDHAIILPWTREINWIPATKDDQGTFLADYYQGGFNPEHPDERRLFPALTDEIRQNPILGALIWRDYDLSFWSDLDRKLPLHLGVHFVKLRVSEPNAEAVSSPNMLHQDGETFTFAHLVTRKNAAGGENVIAQTRCAGFQPSELSSNTILAHFQLERQLDSYGVSDHKVSHYVSPVRQQNPSAPAERGVILIDFVPMKAVL